MIYRDNYIDQYPGDVQQVLVYFYARNHVRSDGAGNDNPGAKSQGMKQFMAGGV